MSRVVVTLMLFLGAGCATDGQHARGASAAESTKEEIADSINHYLSSVIYQNTGEIEAAIEELRRASDVAPESTELTVKLLGAYYVNEDYENAAIMAERALEQEPESVVLNIWKGRINYQLDRYDEATEAFERAIELDPTNALAFEALAEIEEETNDLVGAIGTYRRMLELSPDSAFLHYRLGLNLIEIEDGEGAARELNRALELNPDLTPAHYMLGLISVDAGDYDQARASLLRFLEDNPDNTQAKVNLAAVDVRQGRYAEAVDTLNRIIESAEVDTEHHILRAYILARQDDPARTSLAAAPNGAPLLGTVLQALVKRKNGEPYALLLRDLDSVEGDLDFECNLYLNRIITLFGDEHGEYLAEQIALLVEEGVRSRVVETIEARAHMAVGNNEQAARVLERVAERYGPDKWLHYYLATVYDELDQPRKAEANLRACLAFDSHDPDILNFLGYFLAEQNKNLKEAEALLERALDMDPDNGFYLDSLGWVYYRQGKAEQAIAYIRRAIRNMNSDDAILRDHLGDAYLLNDQPEEAVEQWLRASQLDPELEGVREKLDRWLPRIGE